MNRIADRVDLAIDAVTLGQYGLEQVASTEADGCEAIGRTAGWESPQRSARRRGACDTQYTWDWPRSACRAS